MQETSHEDETGNGLVEEEDDDVIDPLMFIQVIKRVYSQSSAHLSKMTKNSSEYSFFGMKKTKRTQANYSGITVISRTK